MVAACAGGLPAWIGAADRDIQRTMVGCWVMTAMVGPWIRAS
jgi:hypothetical protein